VDLGDDLWQIYGASADRGVALIWRQHYRSERQIERSVSLLNVGSQKVAWELPWPDGEKFAYNDQAVCGVGGKDWHRRVVCVDAETGKQLAVTTGWTAPDIQMAPQARRAVLSDCWRKLDWIDGFWQVGSLRKRVFWDLGTGNQLASWRPKSQRLFMGSGTAADTPWRMPYQFAISPDGEYLVEGGAGVLTLYKVEP
jgi:hypothetical protein